MTDSVRAKRATSRDVAELAGVSRATVSHVLNGRDARFPVETRERVRAAARQLQYRPSPAGRALVNGRSDVIVLVIPNTTFGTNLQDLADALEAAARPLGFAVVVRFAGRDTEQTTAAIEELDPAAVVDIGALPAEGRATLSAAGIPVLPPPGEGERADFVDLRIGRTMAEVLLAGGPDTLVYAALADTRSDVFGPPRYEGMCQVAAEHGLATPAHIAVPLDVRGATAALQPFVQAGRLAVGAYNDSVAIAVIAAARAIGLEVPAGLAVVGVDGTELGQLVSPRLTSIRVDVAALVHRIIDDVRRLRGEAPTDRAPMDARVEVIDGETT